MRWCESCSRRCSTTCVAPMNMSIYHLQNKNLAYHSQLVFNIKTEMKKTEEDIEEEYLSHQKEKESHIKRLELHQCELQAMQEGSYFRFEGSYY